MLKLKIITMEESIIFKPVWTSNSSCGFLDCLEHRTFAESFCNNYFLGFGLQENVCRYYWQQTIVHKRFLMLEKKQKTPRHPKQEW